jgi:hypothetical protein
MYAQTEVYATRLAHQLFAFFIDLGSAAVLYLVAPP